MTEAALDRAIARRVNAEQYTGGRLADIGNAGHPDTVARIVIEVLTKRGLLDVDEGQQYPLKLPLPDASYRLKLNRFVGSPTSIVAAFCSDAGRRTNLREGNRD